MPHPTGSNRFRTRLLTVFLVFTPLAFADVFESSPLVPPADSIYSVPNTCVSVVCLENITISNFDVTSNQISGGNEVTESTVSLGANAFRNVGGTPGAFIGPLTLTGQIDITYFDKTEFSETGTFSDQITSLDLTGSFNGLTGTHNVTAMLNPGESSTGQTTITNIGGNPNMWRFGSYFDIYTEISVDGGSFVPGPERVAQLGVTPEPAYFGIIGVLLAAIMVRRAVRTKSSSARSGAL
jgi:hypothetical protein